MAFTAGQLLRALTTTSAESITAAEARADLDLEVGTDVQAYDALLAAISALVTASDKLMYFTGVDTIDQCDLTTFARTILDDASAAAVITTLGLSTDLVNLTDSEVTQLENIGEATTINAGQWGYLGNMDQDVITTSSPEFAALTLTDGGNIILDTTTGSSFGSSTSQKASVYGVTPVVQGTTIADPAGGVTVDAEARTAINALIDRLQDFGVIA